MLNLLLIISSAKAGSLKSRLKPQLKARIDVVEDFDHGLKDVFEKRPSIVVIQEQIGGVSGDSVARHIQMLLGGGAPDFILAHKGNDKVKTVKGLFEYLVDLNKSEELLVDDILTAIKSILGDKADSEIISTQPVTPHSAAAAVVPQEHRKGADDLVDDFLSALETGQQSSSDQADVTASSAAVDEFPDESFQVVSATDEMASLLIDAARQSKSQAGKVPDSDLSSDAQDIFQAKTEELKGAHQEIPLQPERKTASTAASDSIAGRAAVATAAPSPKVAKAFPRAESKADTAETTQASSPLHAPAEFRISSEPSKTPEPVPEELLQAFEKNYRSYSRSWKKSLGTVVAVAAVAGLGAGGWYLVSHNPGLLSFENKPAQPVANSVTKTSQPVAANLAAVKPEVQKPGAGSGSKIESPPAVQPQAAAPAAARLLPSFVRTDKRDDTYTAKKPGWERYVGKTQEVRIFRSDDRIKAVQVIAGKGSTVPKDFLQTVLKEVTGSGEFSLGDREQKQGFRGYLIQRGNVNNKADLVLYRNKKSDAIAAFVVSLN